MSPRDRSASPKNQKRADFDLEPNPFEQSFSATPRSSSSNVRQNKSPKSSLGPSSGDSDNTNGNKSKSKSPPTDSRPVLPPLSSISSPADHGSSYQWGFTPGITNSLRAGPLSPAMLAGPANASGNPPSEFDPASFRTGLTPRTGMTPRTGLTPLVGGPFPNTPNTTAFMQNTLTITPNTLNAITGAMNGNYSQAPQQSEGEYMNSASNAATSAANGLFLLSQAHQELTKREEAQARSASVENTEPTNGKRGTKRKPVRRSTRGRKFADDDDDDDEDDEDEDMYHDDMPPSKRQHQAMSQQHDNSQKKPETEEEKRKNFLERNRQAALKCRQRKKAWLAQLQAKVEFLQQENERLTTALVTSREEISRLSALVGGVGVGQVNGSVGGVPVSVGVGVGKVENRNNQGGAYGY